MRRYASPPRSSQIVRDSASFQAFQAELGRRVRKLREANEWTLEFAASRTDIELKHLQKIEAGTINMTLITLHRLAVGFSVPLETFFEGITITPHELPDSPPSELTMQLHRLLTSENLALPAASQVRGLWSLAAQLERLGTGRGPVKRAAVVKALRGAGFAQTSAARVAERALDVVGDATSLPKRRSKARRTRTPKKAP